MVTTRTKTVRTAKTTKTTRAVAATPYDRPSSRANILGNDVAGSSRVRSSSVASDSSMSTIATLSSVDSSASGYDTLASSDADDGTMALLKAIDDWSNIA